MVAEVRLLRAHAGDPPTDSPEAGPRIASSLWALLAALLQLPDSAARASTVNPVLVSTAAQACQLVADAGAQEREGAAALAALGAALLDALQLLAARGPLHFAPSLEHRWQGLLHGGAAILAIRAVVTWRVRPGKGLRPYLACMTAASTCQIFGDAA